MLFPAIQTREADPGPGRPRQVFAVGRVGFCAFLSLCSTQPLLPLFHEAFRASRLAVALSAPFVGILADLRGRKKVIVPAIYLLALANLLTATAPNLPWLIAWRFESAALPASAAALDAVS